MYIVDRVNSRIQVFDLNRKFLEGFHFFTTDSEGSLYVGEDMAFRIQKFVPRKDGNPVQIIGPLMQ